MKKWLYRFGWMALGIGALYAASALAGVVSGGSLDPPGPVGSTMKSLDDIPPSWHRSLSSNDGSFCNSSRFRCVLGGAAQLDRETGLVWQAAPPSGTEDWYAANIDCMNAQLGGRYGWRLPRMEEYRSLLDETGFLPAGVFTNVQPGFFWSSSTNPYPGFSSYAIVTRFDFGPGIVTYSKDTTTVHLWCVRGGAGLDGT